MGYSPVITRLIEELARLPGIGSKTAERLAFYIVRSPETEVSGLVAAIEAVKRGIRPCSVCYSPGETDPCPICIDPRRERDVVCVVEEPKDLLSIEKVGSYRGLFHVLMGSLSPIEGVEPDDLTISDLLKRVEKEGIKEVILATNPTTEGDCTSLYIVERLRHLNVKVTRLARGIPAGSHLEFASRAILSDALLGRTAFDNDGPSDAAEVP
ncbi:MAG: recombination mediator RecR [Planctomycetota bacterium]|nr:recombination mediator RecR [Planctomycetota bacterium]